MEQRTRSTARKVLISLGTLGAAAAVAGMGTFGTFTSTTSASEQVNAGTVSIALGAAGSATNRLSVTAANIVPGDTIQRAVTLTNDGNQDLSSLTLTTTAPVTSKLNTDTTLGLQLTIDSCSVPWTEAAAGTGYSYTCSGTTSSVVAARPVIGANTAMTAAKAVIAGGAEHMRVALSLPTGADNSFQGLTSTIGFSFTGTQRAGTNR